MTKNKIYSYTMMERKLRELSERYPTDFFQTESFGTTYGKRHLYACYIGSKTAEKQFVITASIHGREYINTTLLLHMMEYYLAHYKSRYRNLWKNTCIIFLPMLNPDGVSISMSTDATHWKENGRGIDLNRNFPCGFGQSPDRNKQNPGFSAGDQPETQYLMNFINSLSNPIGVIHYHSRGNVIFYDYDVRGPLKSQIIAMASIAHQTTGYRLIQNSQDTKPAGGFGDWCVYEKGIPSITIETGFLKTPVPHWQLNSILYKNLPLLHKLFTCIL